MTEQSILYRAAEIKRQMKALEAEYKEMELDILEQIFTLNPEDKKVDVGDLGRFSVSQRKVWEYSNSIANLTQTLKDLKAEEEANGIATCKEVPQLTFTMRKNE